MQYASAAWLAAAQQSHITPVLYVELTGAGIWFATRTITPAPLWRCDDGLLATGAVLCDAVRGPYLPLLAPYEHALGRVTYALSDRASASYVAGTSITLLNQRKLSDLGDAVVLDNCPIQLSLGFAELGPEHAMLLMRGVIDDYEWGVDALTLHVTDETFRHHRNLSEPLGARLFPGAPAATRGKAVPILIGKQTDTTLLEVEGDASGTLAFALTASDTELYLREFDAPFPRVGTVDIGTEATVSYSFRQAVSVGGVTYLRLSGLARSSGTSHTAGEAVQISTPLYRYVLGYEVDDISGLRRNGTLLDPSEYTLTTDTTDPNHPVTILELPTPGTVTVDTTALADETFNGGFETGTLDGWTPSAGATAVLTTEETAAGTYALSLTGGEDTYEELVKVFPTLPGHVYKLSLAYKTTSTVYHDEEKLSNGRFDTGDLTGWSTQAVDTETFPAPSEAAVIDGGVIMRVPPSQRAMSSTGDGFARELVQDFATDIGETYYLSFSAYARSQQRYQWTPPVITPLASGGIQIQQQPFNLTGNYQVDARVGYALGTPAAPTSIAEVPVASGGRLAVVFSFVATATTTRLTLRGSAHVVRGSHFLTDVTFQRISVIKQADPPASAQAGLDLGPLSDPTHYTRDLDPAAEWTTFERGFQAQDTATRIALKAQWTNAPHAVYVDQLTVIDTTPASFQTIRGAAPLNPGINPADAIAYTIDTFLPTLIRNRAAWDDAYLRLTGWQFDATIPDPGDSKKLIERMADQCKSDLVTHADGEVHLVVFDELRRTEATFTTANILEDTFRAHRETLDNLYTEVFVYYGHRGEGALDDPEAYQGVTYATPNETTHPTEPLPDLCAAAQAIFRRTRRLDVFADMIRDLDTANRLLAHKVERHTTRHDEVALTTSLAAAPVQVADMVAVSHPWLHGGQPQFCQVRERSVRGVEVSFGLRTVRQAGFYESWEPPSMGLPVAVHHETWAPDNTPPGLILAEHWEPPTYSASTIHYETWES